MNDKIISLEIKLEEKRHEIELQKIEYLKLVEEIQNSKRLDDLYKQKRLCYLIILLNTLLCKCHEMAPGEVY
jgi:hypothetical protein